MLSIDPGIKAKEHKLLQLGILRGILQGHGFISLSQKSRGAIPSVSAAVQELNNFKIESFKTS